MRAWPSPDDGAHDQYLKILRLLGQVVTDWAELDSNLVALLCHMADCNEDIGTIIYHALDSFAPKLSILKALALHAVKDENEKKKLLCLLDRLNDLHKARNDLIHASYSASYAIPRDISQPRRRVRLQKRITRSSRKILHHQIAAQTAEIDTHLNLVASLRQFLLFYCGRFRDEKAADQWLAIFLNTDSATSE